MQVVAMRQGFYDGTRRRIGDIFDMAVPSKDGKPVMPSWVQAVTDPTKAKQAALAAKKAEEDRIVAGAKVASGGKAAERKIADARDLAG